jgi:hypothetical protein
MMLLIDKVQTLRGLQVYGDDVDPLTFYVLPEQPRFRLDDKGRPVFKFLKYRTPRPRGDGKSGGGFVIFDAEFAVDDEVRPKIIDDLNQQVGSIHPGAKVKLGTIQWAKGTAKLNFVADGGSLIESVTNPMSPSLFGRNITPFTMELSQIGATFFEQALQGSGGVVQVAYEMNAWVKLPPITGTASFSSVKFYDFVQTITDDSGCGDDTRTEDIRENVISSDVMSVTVDSGTGADRNTVDQIRASLMNTLEKTVAQKMLEQLGQYDGDRGMIEDYESIRRDYHKVRIDSFSYTLNEQTASLWPFNPGGTLPNITTLVDKSGAPIRWDDYAKEIDLDDPFFQSLDVTVRVEGDLESLPINSVDVHLEFDGKHLVVEDMHFVKADDLGKLSCFLDGKAPEYRYSYRVNFTGSARAYEVPAQTTKLKELTINIDDTGLLVVDVHAGDIVFTETPSATVTVRYEPISMPVIEEQFVVDEKHLTYSLQKAIFEPRTKPVQYKIDYRTAEGKLLSTPWRETPRQVAVNSPFHDHRNVHIQAVGNLESEIDSIFIQLDYTDAANGYAVSGTAGLDKDSPFFDWSFPVLDPTAGVVTYSGSISRQDGTVEDIPITVAETNTIKVGEKIGEIVTVTLDSTMVDFAQVALVRVVLRYGSDPATLQRKDLILRESNSHPTWTIELPTRTASHDYSMSAVYYLKEGGTQRQLAASVSDATELIMPSLPQA